jgi:hypothetical protein
MRFRRFLLTTIAVFALAACGKDRTRTGLQLAKPHPDFRPPEAADPRLRFVLFTEVGQQADRPQIDFGLDNSLPDLEIHP